MEQPSLNDHNKQEYPPMHTTEHVINRTMVNLFGCGRVNIRPYKNAKKASWILRCKPVRKKRIL